MARGFESAETEGLQRATGPQICEAYACVDQAQREAAGHFYCEAHVPGQPAAAAETESAG